MRRLLLFWTLLLLAPTCLALGEASWLAKNASKNLVLVDKNTSADLIIDADEFPGVLRAAKNLQTDIEKVSGKKPALSNVIGNNNNPRVIVGTLGKSKIIEQLIAAKKIDVSKNTRSMGCLSSTSCRTTLSASKARTGHSRRQ